MTHSLRTLDQSVYTRRRVLVAAAVALPIVALTQLRRGGTLSNESHPASPTESSPIAPAEPLVAATTSEAATAPPTAPTVDGFDHDHDIGPGSTGTAVGALQNRLTGNGFDPGPADSVFGPATERAVWAFEKLTLDAPPAGVTGVVTTEMWGRLNDPIEVRPWRTGPGSHVEIFLARQVAVPPTCPRRLPRTAVYAFRCTSQSTFRRWSAKVTTCTSLTVERNRRRTAPSFPCSTIRILITSRRRRLQVGEGPCAQFWDEDDRP